MSNWKQRFTVIPAVFMVFKRDDKVLLLRRKGTGYMDGYYSLPAGHVDGGEPAIRAACREAKEEVGIVLEPKDLRLVHTIHESAEGHERINLGFLVENFSGEPKNMEPNKCDELRWAPLDGLPENMVPSIRHMLAQVEAGIPYSDFNFDA
jgi:8-oxo-dGTP diphosphatase